jgi:hypothetical protein
LLQWLPAKLARVTLVARRYVAPASLPRQQAVQSSINLGAQSLDFSFRVNGRGKPRAGHRFTLALYHASPVPFRLPDRLDLRLHLLWIGRCS